MSSLLSDLLTLASVVKLAVGGLLGALVHKLVAGAKAVEADVKKVL